MLDVRFATDRTDAHEPTWTVDVSPVADPVALADTLADAGVNATVLPTIGTWEGATEYGARIVVQGPASPILNTVLDVCADMPGVRWAHVNFVHVDAHYVDLATRTDGPTGPADTLADILARHGVTTAPRAHRSIGGGPCR